MGERVHVGLPTAASIAAQGVEVIGVDVDAERLSAIGTGAPPTAEGDLRELVRKVVAAGRLRTAATPQPADAFIIAVPTPHGPAHVPDVSFVRAAAESLAPLLRPGNLVVLESTSPVGTTEDLCVWLAKSRGDLSFPQAAGEASDVRVAYSPERAMLAAIEGTWKRSASFLFYLVSAVCCAMLEERPDIVIATSPQFFCGWAGVVVGKLRRRPLLIEIRDLWPESIAAVGALHARLVLRILETLERGMYRAFARHIVTVGDGYRDGRDAVDSSAEERPIILGVRDSLVISLMNGVDGDLFLARENRLGDQEYWPIGWASPAASASPTAGLSVWHMGSRWC